MTRRLNTLLVLLMVLAGFPFYWYFINSSTGNAAPQPLSMETLRSLASQIEGQAPDSVRYESVAFRSAQANQFVAGTGLRQQEYPVRAFQLTVPNEPSILIDAGVSLGRSDIQDFEGFDPAAQNRVNRALAAASRIVLLGDAPSHTGGLGPQSRSRQVWPSDAPRAIAPGVVSIPARGLPRRAQMVYVRLANGQEYLFTGDAAMTDAAWIEIRPPARFRTDLGDGWDRDMIASWLMTINALHREAPDMTIVPGRQPGDMRQWPQLQKGFEAPSPARKKNAGQATGHKPRDNVLAARKS